MDGASCVVEQYCMDSKSGYAAEGSLQLVQSTCNYSLFDVSVLISFLCFLPVFGFPSMVGPVPFCPDLMLLQHLSLYVLCFSIGCMIRGNVVSRR